LFFNRMDTPVNLYEEPCYTELTYDRTARRTRYQYAPYSIELPEIPILCTSKAELDTSGGANYQNSNSFMFDGGIGCFLYVADDVYTTNVCGYSNYGLGDNGNPPPIAPYTPVLIHNTFPINVLLDDLGFFNSGYIPQQGKIQVWKDCGFGTPGITVPANLEGWDYANEFHATAGICSCYEIDIKLDIEVDFFPTLIVGASGECEFYQVVPQMWLKWGTYEVMLYDLGMNEYNNGCVSFLAGTYIGDVIHATYHNTVTLPNCTSILRNDKMIIEIRTRVIGNFQPDGILDEGHVEVLCNTIWTEATIVLSSYNCTKDLPRVGTTFSYAYMVHEAFSRLVEHYTNNCLRVRSCYFGRPNSMEGADIAEYQCPITCDTGTYTYMIDNCCQTVFNMAAGDYVSQCITSFTPPPANYPTPCANSLTGSVLALGALGENTCDVILNNDCLEILTPGTYNINMNIVATVLTSSISWLNVRLNTSANISVNVTMYILGIPYVITNQALNFTHTTNFCLTGGIAMPNTITTSFNPTVTVTQADIDFGNNKICMVYQLASANKRIVGCVNGRLTTLTSRAEFSLTSGSIVIQNVDCISYGSYQGSMIIDDSCYPCETFSPDSFQTNEENVDCCTSVFTMLAAPHYIGCNSILTPPPLVFPVDCVQDSYGSLFTDGSLTLNECDFTLTDDCIIITTPGIYNITMATDINTTGGFITWSNTDATSASNTSVSADLYIKGVAYPITSSSLSYLETNVGCNSGGVVSTNVVNNSIVQTVTITAADILSNQNQICMPYQLHTENSVIVGCLNGIETDLSSKAIITLVSGTITIEKSSCRQESGKCCTGCGAFTAITSGISLRNFGTQCFTTFKELFEAMDAIHNIGVGYSDMEPDCLRIENKEYFYNKEQIFSITLDERQSKFARKSNQQMYYNSFETGYSDWAQDVVNTIDEFNTERDYTLSVKNSENKLMRRCDYIGSGYTIEVQRRRRYTADSDFDDKKFVICTERDSLLLSQVELGVDSPQTSALNPPFYAPNGFINAAAMYNWRISPYFNAVRWLNYLRASFFRNPNGGKLYFAKGTVNYECGGNEPGVDEGCDVGIDYSLLPVVIEESHYETDDISTDITFPRAAPFILPEIVTFEYPLTVQEIMMIKSQPYKTILVNKERFFIKEITFKFQTKSKFTLIKAY